jgi:hypothetical protein
LWIVTAAHGLRQARAERGLARGRLADPGLQHVAHEAVGDVGGIHAGPGDGSLDGGGAELRADTPAKAPWKAPMGERVAERMTMSVMGRGFALVKLQASTSKLQRNSDC